MFSIRKKDKQKKRKKKIKISLPDEPKNCMGTCPRCGSRETSRLAACSMSPTKDAAHEVFSLTHGVPVSFVGNDEYREATSFGNNAVCRRCYTFFRGKKEPFEADPPDNCESEEEETL